MKYKFLAQYLSCRASRNLLTRCNVGIILCRFIFGGLTAAGLLKSKSKSSINSKSVQNSQKGGSSASDCYSRSKALREEIRQLRIKPMSEPTPPPSFTASYYERSELDLMKIPRSNFKPEKYFPITPIGSSTGLQFDINIRNMLFDCLDAMRVTRDDADLLLKELTDELPVVLAGTKSRYEVVDGMVKKWLTKYGGDPSLYKKQTRAFDTLAALADKLIRQHVEAMEGSSATDQQVMQHLEQALRGVSDSSRPLKERLGPALAALFHAAESQHLETDETMTSLVNSLVDEEHPITAESVDQIVVSDVMEDIKECGVEIPSEEMERIVNIAVQSLRAQLVSPEEESRIDAEVDKAITASQQTLASLPSQHSVTSHHSTTSQPSQHSVVSHHSTTSQPSQHSVVSHHSTTSQPSQHSVVSHHSTKSQQASSKHSVTSQERLTGSEHSRPPEGSQGSGTSHRSKSSQRSQHSRSDKKSLTSKSSRRSITDRSVPADDDIEKGDDGDDEDD